MYFFSYNAPFRTKQSIFNILYAAPRREVWKQLPLCVALVYFDLALSKGLHTISWLHIHSVLSTRKLSTHQFYCSVLFFCWNINSNRLKLLFTFLFYCKIVTRRKGDKIYHSAICFIHIPTRFQLFQIFQLPSEIKS